MILADNRFFRPLLWPTLVTLAALAILIGLGAWQIERLHWKLDLIADHRRVAWPSPPRPRRRKRNGRRSI